MNRGKFSPSAIAKFGAIKCVTRFIKTNAFGDVRESTVKDPYGETFYAVPTTKYGITTVTVKEYLDNTVYHGEFGKVEYPEMAKKEIKLVWHDGLKEFYLDDEANGKLPPDCHDETGNEAAMIEAAWQGVINLPVNPQTLSKSGSEHGEQVALFCALNYLSQWYPDLEFIYATPNGGSRGDTEKSRKIEGGKMKAEGVKPGVPDIFVPLPRLNVGNNTLYPGMYIEMKTVDGGDGGSDNQKRYMEFLKSKHFYVVLCNGHIEALKQIRWYLEL